MALVDVDETFRKPILGKAFYNEPVLTVGRLFDRLRLQEESKGKEPVSKLTEQTGSLPKRLVESGAGLDDSKSLSCAAMQETADSANQSERSFKQTGLEAGSCGKEKQKRKRRGRPKVDYQQVSQRHVKQLFIRGENILLISLRQ